MTDDSKRVVPYSLAPINGPVSDLMARLGPMWADDVPGHVRQMIAAFTELHRAAPKPNVELTRGTAYGGHPRQILDIYKPVDVDQAPVLVFVHGGAFVDGDKDRSPEIYSNVLYYFAWHGVIGINVEYRLAPEFRYPAGAQDIALAVNWVQKNIAASGGDSQRIYLMGHSAGAAHTGSYAYDKTFHPASGPGIAGHIVVSGRVRAETWPGNPNAEKVKAYYGPEILEKHSPVNHVGPASVPTMIAIAEFENPYLDVHCAELFHRIAHAKGRAPRILRLDGHNHTSIIAHLNTQDERLGREILRFMASCP